MSKHYEMISPVQPLLDPKIHCKEYKLLHCVPLVLVKHIQWTTVLLYEQGRVQNMFYYLLLRNQFNPLNPKIKIWILIFNPYSFPTEVMGRSW